MIGADIVPVLSLLGRFAFLLLLVLFMLFLLWLLRRDAGA